MNNILGSLFFTKGKPSEKSEKTKKSNIFESGKTNKKLRFCSDLERKHYFSLKKSFDTEKLTLANVSAITMHTMKDRIPFDKVMDVWTIIWNWNVA